MKVKLVLEYGGEGFCGWQHQQGQRTVQGLLEECLFVFLRAEARKRKIDFDLSLMPAIQGSGRTDSGVHALHQVATFAWPDTLLPIAQSMKSSHLAVALEGIAKRAFLVRSAEYVPDSFDARFSPHRKCYQYYLRTAGVSGGHFQDRAWSVGPNLKLKEMIECARMLAGEHDFSAFRASDCQAQSTVRTIYASELCRIDNSLLVYSICGKGFLKQMVRIIVGTLVGVGRGRYSVDDVSQLLCNGRRCDAGQTAPAYGLVLSWIKYDDLLRAGSCEN